MSAALLLRHSLGLEAAAQGIEKAVASVLDDGFRTADIAAAGTIPLGTTATVFLSASSASLEAMTLPTSAVWQEAGKSSVWIVDPASMKVRSQAVQVSGVHDNLVVISSGLEPGQQVVTAGVHVLSAGQKVTYFKAAGEKP